MQVLELPPSESFRRKVSFESLYGICLDLPPADSTKELITSPSVVKDLLIFVASFNLSPAAAVYFCLSEPARSTKCNLELFTFITPSLPRLLSMVIVKQECERELSKFI